MKKELLAAGILLLSFMSPLKSLATTHVSKIYVFGDSLSDPGNLYNATQSQVPPSPPYSDGRFSNGEVWVEYLGEKLGLSPTLVTELQNNTPTEGINYAFGGSSSGLGNTLVPESLLPGVLGQVGLFTRSLRESNQSADPNALYIVWGGGNDYVFGNVTDVSQPIANLSRSVALLALAGAKNIMVVNLPDLGKLPLTSGQENSSQLTSLSRKHNIALAATLINSLSAIPGVNIIPINVNSLFQRVRRFPSEFGLTNVTDACLVGDFDDIAQGNFTVCTNPNEYLFWDSVHPTTHVHRIVAETALSALDTQPVPAPWQNQEFEDLLLLEQ
ncbi:SGNH/GDSL hydrolase family protein [Fischerella thermalis]|uniref:SGNH/GDSL hydrolase family protein n=2 Tax=Fischerella thermalis TaxID=372787 RepID=UPI000C8063F9|nr:SGNH/GDSL hydrolase family protein [Fischerella thermalis]MBF1991380.1 SGNH/GDSL hydrolase family protein [Fischerella thermalis M58_A2018_009]PLZ92706.1 GDSL family lipase [Fischerella thermalis CCMEE 5194]